MKSECQSRIVMFCMKARKDFLFYFTYVDTESFLAFNSRIPYYVEYITNMTSHLVTNLTHGTWYDVTVTSVIGAERSHNSDVTKSVTS